MWEVNRVLEKYLGDDPSIGMDIKMAAAGIYSLLSSIDLRVEEIPVNNLDMLSRLVTSLKGEELSLDEWKILKEITS